MYRFLLLDKKENVNHSVYWVVGVDCFTFIQGGKDEYVEQKSYVDRNR